MKNNATHSYLGFFQFLLSKYESEPKTSSACFDNKMSPRYDYLFATAFETTLIFSPRHYRNLLLKPGRKAMKSRCKIGFKYASICPC